MQVWSGKSGRSERRRNKHLRATGKVKAIGSQWKERNMYLAYPTINFAFGVNYLFPIFILCTARCSSEVERDRNVHKAYTTPVSGTETTQYIQNDFETVHPPPCGS